MRAVDTNVLVRLITMDDRRQAAAASEFVANGAWVSHLALAETTWVLESVYERTPAEVAAAVEILLNHRELVLQDPDVVAAAVQVFSRRSGVGFSDCLMLEITRKAGHLPLGTFDRGLSRLDGTRKL
jgi:predicted nucleic-acid-binding protein